MTPATPPTPGTLSPTMGLPDFESMDDDIEDFTEGLPDKFFPEADADLPIDTSFPVPAGQSVPDIGFGPEDETPSEDMTSPQGKLLQSRSPAEKQGARVRDAVTGALVDNPLTQFFGNTLEGIEAAAKFLGPIAKDFPTQYTQVAPDTAAAIASGAADFAKGIFKGTDKPKIQRDREGNIIPTNRTGGVNLGNPIIVGDSNNGTENEELVLSQNGAPMVVLPLDANQQRIMQNANRFIPRAQNGIPQPNLVLDPNAPAPPNMHMPGTLGDQPASNPLGLRQQYDMTNPYAAGLARGLPPSPSALAGMTASERRIAQDRAGIPSGRDLFRMPGFTGNITQQEIQDRSDLLTPPRARAVTSGGLRTSPEGGYRFRPEQQTRFGALGPNFAMPTPAYLSALSENERAFLKSNLATRNIFLKDVEQDAKRRFGLTGSRSGKRRFR